MCQENKQLFLLTTCVKKGVANITSAGSDQASITASITE